MTEQELRALALRAAIKEAERLGAHNIMSVQQLAEDFYNWLTDPGSQSLN